MVYTFDLAKKLVYQNGQIVGEMLEANHYTFELIEFNFVCLYRKLEAPFLPTEDTPSNNRIITV